jgi:hypothetical protein
MMNRNPKRSRVGLAVLAGAWAALSAGPAWAECRNPAGDAASSAGDEAVAAAVVGGNPKVFFVQDSLVVPGCPNNSAGCRAKAYLMNGDVVLVTNTQGAYRCATFTSGRGVSTTDWLPAASVAPLAPQAIRLDDWAGQWVIGEQQITITRAGGQLSLKGVATYGASDPERVRRGAVNVGDFDVSVAPQSGHVAFTISGDATLPYDQGEASDCRVRLSLIGPYLVAKDNDNCGGHNVSFTGVYRRKGT